MLEMNMTIAFPAAPLLTVILALVGKLTSRNPDLSLGSGFTLNQDRRVLSPDKTEIESFHAQDH